ncbi:MAG TPA: carboxypeptidase-like regulatory domain-containing protein [Vicinamibacterales bacterium]|nr:carboxypeptidase-like regulatory domain-containing protein [Vicinamibacterales bacterium]
MHRSTRLCVVCLRVLCLLGAAAMRSSYATAAPPQVPVQINPGDGPMQFLQPGRQAKTGTSMLRGRVVAGDTGTIVRRAQVRISSADIGTKTAFTDAQGHYEFKGLPAGRFTLSVSKSGFVTMQYGQNRPFEPGRPIELTDGQVMDKADVALPRGGALSGRVVDEFGDPVADANVSAMRMQYTGGRRRLAPTGRASTTNDLGQFRLFGLPPGEYYVSATLRSMDSMIFDMLGSSGGGPVGSNNSTGYAATYYPGTPNPGEAQRVSLSVGQEMSTVDIQMQTVHLARITGVATNSDGKAMANAIVMLMPTMKEAMAFAPGGTSRTDKNGNFTLSGVAPGDYTMQIQSMAALMSVATEAMSMMGGDAPSTPAPPAPPVEREFVSANLTVAGDDITGMVVTGTRGAKATGRLVFEGGQKPDNITSLRLIAEPTDMDTMPAAASVFGASSVKDTGAFEIDSLVGARAFRLVNLPKGWFLKHVTHEGADVTDKGFEFKPGDTVENFEIVLTNKEQTVTGTVVGDKGDPVKEYTVIVFTDDQQKWSLAENRWLASARADQQGQFRITGLPAGSYNAIALEYVDEGEWRDPDWLARAAKTATKFTLDEGGTKTLDLKLGGS